MSNKEIEKRETNNIEVDNEEITNTPTFELEYFKTDIFLKP